MQRKSRGGGREYSIICVFTSKKRASVGEGEAIQQSIDWDTIPWAASHRIFKLLKEETIRLSDEGFTLLRISELMQQLEMWLPSGAFTHDDSRPSARPWHVWQLEFGQ